MKKIFYVAIATLLVLQGAASARADDISGKYQIVNPDGSASTGEVVVDNRGKEVYYVDWKFPDASKDYYGVGLLVDKTLCVGWSAASGYGIVVYRVDGGSLTGEWVADSTAEFPGREDLEGPPGLNGNYDIVRAYGDDMGDVYYGNVEIHPNGELYDLKWTIKGNQVTGVGLLKGDLFIVGWGAAIGGVVYYDLESNRLAGRRAVQESQAVGPEILVREANKN